MATRKNKDVWDRPAPRNARHTRLSGKQKAAAKASAKRAGRPYPNLVDNLKVAKKKAAPKKKSAAKKKKRAAKGRKLKDPRGGLTQAGRDRFEATQGSHLKPGVKKKRAAMTPEDLHRKGSWAVRFYGRKGTLPPLVKPDGAPTRYALSAAAWGEPVPRTVAAARRIAAKGHALLAAYSRATAR